jgi:ATP-dependent Lon protease
VAHRHTAEAPEEDLRGRIQSLAGDLIVPKSLPLEGALGRLPRFVAEYLVGNYGLEEATDLVERYFPVPANRQTLLYRLTTQGTLTVLDHVSAFVDLQHGVTLGQLGALPVSAVDLPAGIVDEHPALLGAGLWGRVSLVYRPTRRKNEPKVSVTNFIPISTDVRLERLVELRRALSVYEWTDLILQSLGFNVAAWNQVPNPWRTKLLLMARLVPLVEPHYNMIELGPRNTGKTYLYRNVSAGTFVVSGGMTTPASLFVNLRDGQTGILGHTECVVFDEVAGLAIHDDFGTTSILKDYMESGHFSRGGRDYAADASLVFLGNLETEGRQPASSYTHLFRDLPAALLDTAIIDRLHAFLPGWEIPKMTPDLVTSTWGLAADSVGAAFRQLRYYPADEALHALVARHGYADGLTQRDRRAVDKTLRGLLKLLHLGLVPNEQEGRELLALAAEFRQRVHNQLVQLAPGEFHRQIIGFQGVDPFPAADLLKGLSLTRHDQRLNQRPQPGEVTALLARVDADGVAVDGEVQVIEASVMTGSTGLRLTGFHGKAMEQSATAAYHYIKEHLTDFRLGSSALDGTTIAVHLVSIAVQREGPSAGLAFLLAMVSALTNRPVIPALAVTGEVSLHGDIEPVGGLLPKLYAALRRGRRVVLVPEANRGEVEEARELLGDQLDIQLVATVREALAAAFHLAPGGQGA